MELVKRFFPLGRITEGSLASGTEAWRERIYDAMMSTILLWGWIAIIPSVWLSIVSDLWSVAIADGIAYLSVVLLSLSKEKLPYKVRAPIFLLIGLSIGVTVLLLTGDEGAGFLWIFAIPPFASLLVDLRWGLVFELINIAILFGLGVLIHLGFADAIRVSEFSLGSWIVYCANFVLAESIVTVPLGVLLDGLFKASDEQQQRFVELEAIGKVSASLRQSDDLDVSIPDLLETMIEIFNTQAGAVWLYDPEENLLKLKYSIGYVDDQGNPAEIPPEPPGTGLAGSIFASGEAKVTVDYSKDETIPAHIRDRIPPGAGGAAVVIRSADQPLGLMNINTRAPREFTRPELNLLKTLADIAGTAIQRIYLHRKTENQLKQFRSLAEIDHVILASFDLKYNLTVLLKSILEELQVSAANVMVFDAEINKLRSVMGQGFVTDAFEERSLLIGEGNAGWVAQSRRPLYIEDLNAQEDNPRLLKALRGENLTSFTACLSSPRAHSAACWSYSMMGLCTPMRNGPAHSTLWLAVPPSPLIRCRCLKACKRATVS